MATAATAWPSPAAGKTRFDVADLEDDRSPEKLTITLYGPKDGGKSTQAFALKGHKFVLALDGMSRRARDNSIHKADPNIHVFTGYKFYNETEPATAQTTVDYLNWAIDQEAASGHQPDWIVFDAFDILAEIAEGVMRNNHGLKRSDSFANKNLWKERKDVIRGLWRHALSVARLGVVFCTYYKEEALQRENGEVVLSRKAPHWMDIVEHETSITVEVTFDYSPIAKKNLYRGIATSKFDNPNDVIGVVFKPGETFDLSDGKVLPWNERLAKFYALADGTPLSTPAGAGPTSTATPAATAGFSTINKPKPVVTTSTESQTNGTAPKEKKVATEW